ncbi:DUF4838 domain-containing protein [Poriferisphaera sp. WC338]|uniref:DUF4838 domain-containing protein n=1 Tax=Poriferisphaera sp. WC338 TaxID=3425129 RepID=UPI003D815D6C
MIRNIVIFIGCLVYSLLLGVCAYGEVELQSTGQLKIELPSKPSATEKFAAEELKKYVSSMLSANQAGGSDVVFSIGKTAANISYRDQFNPAVKSDGNDSFVIDVKDGVVHLVGGGDRGTLYAVYELLEQQGCRWFFPGELGEVVPKKNKLSFATGKQFYKPDNIQREIDGATYDGVSMLDVVDWCAKNRINRKFSIRYIQLKKAYPNNRDAQQAWTKRGGAVEWHWICHNFSFMLKEEDDWFAKKPEWFSLYKGKRIPMGMPGKRHYGGGNLCTTNEELIKFIADFAIKWFDDHPEGTVVPIWPADGAVKWCECDDCKALGGINFMKGDKGSMSRRLITFTNAIAKRVKQKHPDRLLLLPAYSNYIIPVPDIKLEDNIFVQYCYHGSYAHGPEQSKLNEASAKQMKQWAELAPKGQFGVWEYFLIGDVHEKKNTPVILPLVYRTRDTLNFLNKIGSRRYFTQSNPVYQAHNPLVYYAVAKLAWDHTIDVDALIDDYCANMFGDGGPAMAEYYKTLEKATYGSDWQPLIYSDVAQPSPLVFTDEVIAKTTALLEKAEAATTGADDKIRKRLAVARKAHDYTTANISTQSIGGLDQSVAWRLERKRNTYTINADGPDVDAKRLEDLVRHAHDTGQFDASFERTIFRSHKRKERVVHLSNNAIRVSVVPGIGGRIIRMTDKKAGHNFFKEDPGAETMQSIGQSYFAYGGYEEFLGKVFPGPGWEQAYKYELSKSKEATTLTMIGSVGEIEIQRKIVLPRGSAKKVTITTTLSNLSSKTQDVTLRVHPLMDLGEDLSSAEIYVLDDASKTQKMNLLDQHDGIKVQPAGRWAAFNPQNSLGIVHEYPASKASAYVFCASDDGYFNMELIGETTSLKADSQLTWMQTYEVVNSMESLESLMGAPLVEQSTASEDAGDVSDSDSGEKVKPLRARTPDFVEGVVGQGLQFNGNSELSFNADYIKANAGTLMMWINLDQDALDTSNAFLIGLGDNNPGWFTLGLSAGELFCLSKVRENDKGIDPHYLNLVHRGVDWMAGEWHHVAVVWANTGKESSLVRIYIDGEMIAERYNATLGNKFDVDGPLSIGRSSASINKFVNAKYDEVMIFNRPLSGDTIGEIFDAHESGKPAEVVEGLLLHVPFENAADGQSQTKGALSDLRVKKLADELLAEMQ